MPTTGNREIGFRGMSINGEWYHGLLSHSQGHNGQPAKGWYISNKAGMPWAYEVRPETIGRLVGLKDKNECDIYEGDEVEYEWNDSWTGEWVTKYGTVEYKNGEYFPVPNNDSIREFKVIGNTHQLSVIIENY